MSDITMCQYSECEKANSCRRYLDESSPEQCYARFQNICSEDNNYQYFIQASEALINKTEALINKTGSEQEENVEEKSDG